MARNFNGTSHYIEAASAVVTAEPLTLACWAYKPTGSAGSYIMMIGSTVLGVQGFRLLASAATQVVSADRLDLGGTKSSSMSGMPLDTWFHLAGVFASSTLRTVYLNGVAGAANTTANSAIDTLSKTLICARYNGAAIGGHNEGGIAEVGIWNAALTADEIVSIAKNYSPRMIRPQALVFHCPLIRDVQDLRGGITLTDTGTTAADHPQIILPT